MHKQNWLITGIQIVVTASVIQVSYAQRKPVQVSIDTEKTYQTIEGFGASIIDYTEPPAFFNDPKLYDLAVNDLGMSILRMSFPQELEAVNDDSDPNHFNWPAYNMPFLERRMRIALEFKKRGVEKFIASTWSPPEFTKTHHATIQGGYLRMDMYEEYAENMAAFIIAAKQNWGIDIGALSIQNELMFIEPYKSCIYVPEQAREAVRALMHKFDKEGIQTQIQLPEDMMFLERMLGYIAPTMADPETKNFHGSFATHRQQGFNTVRKWYEATKQYNRQTWMTETSGHHQNWQGAIKMASDMYDYLVGGNMSAWVYWQIAEPKSEYALMDGANTSPKYFAAKHFYRYVRPGALRVDGQSTDDDILVSAFRHNEQGTITVVLINRDDTDADVKLALNGKDLPKHFTWFRSTEQEQCELQGIQKTKTLAVALPPQSIVTLIGENKALQTEKIAQWPQAWEPPADAQNQKWGNWNKIPEGPGAALSNVIQWQGPEALKKELTKGADIHATLDNGWTPLHTAILNGKLEAVKLLLEVGANVNQPAKDGWTPLHMAASTFVGGGSYHKEGETPVTKYDVFKAVLAAKPIIDARTKEGHTPLHAAVMNAHTAWRQDEETNFNRITDLLQAGANLEATDEAGRTPLHWAAWQANGRMTDMVRASDGVINVLITAGSNLNALDKRGRTPLHYAAEMGYIPVVVALVRAGANTRLKDRKGNTPEALAQARALSKVVTILQNKAAAWSTPTALDTPDTTPAGKHGAALLQAAWKGDLVKVKELIAKDADVFYRDSDGFRAVDRARDNGYKEIVKLLQMAESRKVESQK